MLTGQISFPAFGRRVAMMNPYPFIILIPRPRSQCSPAQILAQPKKRKRQRPPLDIPWNFTQCTGRIYCDLCLSIYPTNLLSWYHLITFIYQMIQSKTSSLLPILEDNIEKLFTNLWSKVPNLWNLKLDLSRRNPAFVAFAMVVGTWTFLKCSKCLLKKSVGWYTLKKVPKDKDLQEKYGKASWALVSDVQRNEQYCKYLAKHGFNLYLIGKSTEDINIVSAMLDNIPMINRQLVQIRSIIINWDEVEEKDTETLYRQILEDIKYLDVSVLILPKVTRVGSDVETVRQHIPTFKNILMLARYLGPKLKDRNYQSAIIFRSDTGVDEISPNNGAYKSIMTGIDGFGRILAYELKGSVDVIVARGEPQHAFQLLGVQPISE